MSQKENTNTFVVCSLKGGVGTTTISSEILATLLHREDRTVTIYRPDSFNVIDDEPQNFKLVHIGTKSIQLQNFGKRINTNCIDFLFKKTKDINDCLFKNKENKTVKKVIEMFKIRNCHQQLNHDFHEKYLKYK